MITHEYNPNYILTKQVIKLIEEGYPYRATIKKCESVVDSGVVDVIFLNFEVVGICQHRVYDIRDVEPLKIHITDNSIPIVFLLRSSFPPVPHLNIHEDVRIKSMCYSALPYEEILSKLNGRFLLECINDWFVKTARNELHRPDQPLEPFFLGVKETIIFHPSFLDCYFGFFKNVIIDGQHLLIQTDVNEPEEKIDCYAICRINVAPKSENIIHHPPKTLFELSNMFTEQPILESIKSFHEKILEIRHYPKIFNQLFKQSLRALLNCKTVVLLNIPLVRFNSKTAETVDFRAFIIEASMSRFLNDFGVRKETQKNNSPPKFIYCNEHDNSGKNVTLRMLNLQLDFTSRYAQIMNDNCDSEVKELFIAQIGVGALGSQVFENCLRAGLGKWYLIDNDRFWSHNISRHTLLRNNIGEFKANALAHRAKSIVADIECMSICENIFSGGESIKRALANSDLIVDTSASIAVERYLALDSVTNARKISFFLNPSGNYTIMFLENKRKTIRLDLLEMQYYQYLLLNPSYENHLSLPDTVTYATTCRSETSRLSQDNIALSAALCSKALKKYTTQEDAKIIIWNHFDESVITDMIVAEEWEQVNYNEWSVYVRKNLFTDIYNQRKESLPNETGGVLIGCFDYGRKILYIVSQIEPPDDSIASPTSFIRGCLNLEKKLKYILKTTSDNLYYVGEWHSHPSADTRPTPDDMNLFSAIVEYNRGLCKPSCMLISGENDVNLLISE